MSGQNIGHIQSRGKGYNIIVACILVTGEPCVYTHGHNNKLIVN